MSDLSGSELRAIEIALDELVSYIDTVGIEGGLDDEEMPTQKLEWARDKLRALLDRHGVQSRV
jgi:hypothetical protein